MEKTKNAIEVCSGGVDSSVTAYYVKKKLNYKRVIVLFFNYSQKSLEQERVASKRIAKELGIEFKEIRLEELGKISDSLINKSGKIKKIKKKDLKNTEKESKKFYVPCRNSVFLIYALSLAESLFIKSKKRERYDIFVGFKNEGKESYPDTTNRFVREMNKLSRISSEGKFEIKAPLIKMDKEDIILLGKRVGIDLSKTFSCYAPIKGKQCGFCLACQLRKAGFYWAGLKDESEYFKKS